MPPLDFLLVVDPNVVSGAVLGSTMNILNRRLKNFLMRISGALIQSVFFKLSTVAILSEVLDERTRHVVDMNTGAFPVSRVHVSFRSRR